jgi:hypothetical protein
MESISSYSLAGPKFFCLHLSSTYLFSISEFVDSPFSIHLGNDELPHANGAGRQYLWAGPGANWM